MDIGNRTLSMVDLQKNTLVDALSKWVIGND